MRTLAELQDVRVGDMTTEEQRAVVNEAFQRLKRELEANRQFIQEILDTPKVGR